MKTVWGVSVKNPEIMSTWNRQTNMYIYIRTQTQTDRETDRDRHTQTYRHTDTHTDNTNRDTCTLIRMFIGYGT